ncbi:putative site-specific recombinase [Oscillibacter valericigenes Sjm18-20]|nr:putative site-specific recombinase [Oscillibacter valericigenes Sjm18-20]
MRQVFSLFRTMKASLLGDDSMTNEEVFIRAYDEVQLRGLVTRNS